MQLQMVFSVTPICYSNKSSNMIKVSSDFTSIVAFCYLIIVRVRVKPTARHGMGHFLLKLGFMQSFPGNQDATLQ